MTALILDYFSMLINLLYLLTVIITLKVEKPNQDLKVAKEVTDFGLKIIIGLIIVLAIIKYYQKFKVKNCFVGSCLADKKNIIFVQISPKYLEGNK